MKNITAVVSLLHQPASPTSIERLFRREPVLAWTLRRIAASGDVTSTAILCWEDQFQTVEPLANAARAFVLAKGPRCPVPLIEAIAAARRWSDGWRGSLLGACHFDLGFHAPWTDEIRQRLASEAVLLVDPDAALVDPVLLSGLAAHARSHPNIGYCFTPAAPGLSGVLIRPALLEKLAASESYLGRLLAYSPDLPGRDPISKEECAPVPTRIARTTARFTLDSDRQVELIERCTASLNGTLLQSQAEELVARLSQYSDYSEFPRDVVLELNTRRSASPVYGAGAHLQINRPKMPMHIAAKVFADLAACDDVRLTISGVGDPLLADHFFDVLDAAYKAGIRAIHVETDLLTTPKRACRLAESPADIVSVHIPATTASTYQAVMGVDSLTTALENTRQFLSRRKELGRGTPLLVPTFVKCSRNLHEMEAWYDYWLRAVGCALISGPSDFTGQVPDVAVADMSPPARVACRRLASRLTILSDGRVVACEQDVLARQPLGQIGCLSLQEIWKTGFDALRQYHAARHWHAHPLCSACREWHRP